MTGCGKLGFRLRKLAPCSPKSNVDECNEMLGQSRARSEEAGANILDGRTSANQMSGKWFERHPWLLALGALLCSLANAYEAMYVRPNSLMSIVDWAFALVGFLAFVGLLLSALSDHFSRPEGQ